MMSNIFTLPGELVEAQHTNSKLDAGLLQEFSTSGPSSVIATQAGLLKQSAKGNKYWIESNSKRYVPVSQEHVVGVVTGKVGEGWRVDIGTAHTAILDGYAFEGATKRNKPNLKINSVVYARVSSVHKDMDPELECFDAQTRKASGFGELKDGFLTHCSLCMCRLLLSPDYYLLPLLGSKITLEVAVGMNGRVWISTKSPKHTIAVARCIEAADMDGGAMGEATVQELLTSMNL